MSKDILEPLHSDCLTSIEDYRKTVSYTHLTLPTKA